MLAGFAAFPPLTRRAGHRDKAQQYKGSGRLAAENGIDYDTLYRQDKETLMLLMTTAVQTRLSI